VVSNAEDAMPSKDAPRQKNRRVLYIIIGLVVFGFVGREAFFLLSNARTTVIPEPTTISTGSVHTVALRSDGTVVATGRNNYGQLDVCDWYDIVAVSAGGNHTVGLRSDGRVVSAGSNYAGQRDLSRWRNIVAVYTSSSSTIGLRPDGTVVVEMLQANFLAVTKSQIIEMYDIVSVSVGAGTFSTVAGIKSDGSVVVAGFLWYGMREEIYEWRDIVAVSVNINHIVGLRAYGTMVAAGYNLGGLHDVSDWYGIKLP